MVKQEGAEYEDFFYKELHESLTIIKYQEQTHPRTKFLIEMALSAPLYVKLKFVWLH